MIRPLALALLLLPLPALAQAPDIRVQVTPRQHTVLSSELSGKIVEMAVREGEAFKKGDRLVAFDCAMHRARLDNAAAAAEAAVKKLESVGKLDKLSAVSGLELSDSAAKLTMAQAELSMARTLVQRCTIAAPFAGRVAERKAQAHEYVAEGKELLAIYDDGAFELEMIVPSRWLAWLKPGQPFAVRVDETGQDYGAEVARLSGRVDPVSQSVKVFGRIKGKADGLLPGMSGTARLTPPAGSTP